MDPQNQQPEKVTNTNQTFGALKNKTKTMNPSVIPNWITIKISGVCLTDLRVPVVFLNATSAFYKWHSDGVAGPVVGKGSTRHLF